MNLYKKKIVQAADNITNFVYIILSHEMPVDLPILFFRKYSIMAPLRKVYAGIVR
jgi:hypothetical protein